jgi:hypothetical protein
MIGIGSYCGSRPQVILNLAEDYLSRQTITWQPVVVRGIVD